MNKKDYRIKKGPEKVKFLRAVKINDKDTNLSIEVTLNHNKGLYTLQPKVSTSEVSGDATLDKAMCKVVGDLLYEATLYCEKWRSEWRSNQPKDENDEPKLDL